MDKKIKAFFGPKVKGATQKKELGSMLKLDKKLDTQISKGKKKPVKK